LGHLFPIDDTLEKRQMFNSANNNLYQLIYISPAPPELGLDSIVNFDMDIPTPDTVCKITTLTPNDFKKILLNNNKKKTLIHFWGLFYPLSALGIQSIREILPSNDKFNLILINTDMKTVGQINVIRKFLFQKDININSYIIDNQFNSDDDLENFLKMPHLLNFINAFDKDFEQADLPYTVILDENNKIIYKRSLNFNINKCNLHLSSEELLQLKQTIEPFKNMEIEKIKSILNK
jgi:hypothetical protein